ncbi:MAG: hypothetical protein PVI50_01000 [Gammaproteobacteria bacterium]|jgi:hypothetical protein
MEKLFILLLIIVVTGAILWLFLGHGVHTLHRLGRRQKLVRPASKPASARQIKAHALDKLSHSKQFWGVEIQQAGCPASIELAHRHYSFEAAPRLPLEDCTATHCPCQYKGLVEHRRQHRRTREDRRDSLRFDVNKPDRRSAKDRRRGFDQWKGRT